MFVKLTIKGREDLIIWRKIPQADMTVSNSEFVKREKQINDILQRQRKELCVYCEKPIHQGFCEEAKTAFRELLKPGEQCLSKRAKLEIGDRIWMREFDNHRGVILEKLPAGRFEILDLALNQKFNRSRGDMWKVTVANRWAKTHAEAPQFQRGYKRR